MARYKKRSDGRYATSILIGRTADGKREKLFLSAKTERELIKKVTDAQIKIRSGKMVKRSETKLSDYIKDWEETYKSSVGINTKAMYKNIISGHINPVLGDYEVGQIQKSDVQRLINSNADHPRTCEQIRMTLIQVFNSAIDDKMILDNPAKKVVLPKYQKNHRRALTDMEREAIRNADFTDKERAFVLLLFYFGLRRGEALALTKEDINLEKKILSVNKTIVFDENTPIIKTGAKSDAGNRKIPVPESSIAFFRGFLDSVDTFYLFPGKSTETLSKTQYVRMWERIIRKMNNAVTTDNEKLSGTKPITNLTAHIFRHNYCTMLYYSGISHKKAVELMGHADIKMIMEVYAHLDEEKELVQDKINNAIAL